MSLESCRYRLLLNPLPNKKKKLSRVYFRYVLAIIDDIIEDDNEDNSTSWNSWDTEMTDNIQGLCLLASRHHYGVGWVLNNVCNMDVFGSAVIPPGVDMTGPDFCETKQQLEQLMATPKWWKTAEC